MTLAVTWWGHATSTVELGSTRVVTDPVLVDRFAHLVRHAPSPTSRATEADVVLISHLHPDHLHAPSTARFAPDVPFVVPRAGRRWVRGDREVIEASPGDRLEIAGATIEVLSADHPGTRTNYSRERSEALGFRVTAHERSFWYPGDTGPDIRFDEVAPVDLALVPIGGWGPTLGLTHVGPAQAAAAVERVGARFAVPVHHGTFWPIGLRRLAPRNHRRLFVDPVDQFVEVLADSGVVAVLPGHGRHTDLTEQSAAEDVESST